MEVWKSEKMPGVEEARTRVSVLEIIKKCGNEELKALAEKATVGEREVHMLFSAKPMQPILPPLDIFGADGSPTTAFDMAIEGLDSAVRSVARNLKEGGKIQDVEWLVVGSPVVPGGKVTQGLLDKMTHGDSYQTIAELKAEMAAAELSDPNVKLIMTGHSYGASMAVTTARIFEKEHPELASRVRVLADDPILLYEKKEDQEKGKSAVKGAVFAALSEVWSRRKDMMAKAWITKEFKKVLENRGISTTDTPEQASFKSEAIKIIDRDLMEGMKRVEGESAFPDTIKTYVRQGAFDETDPSVQRENDWDTFLNSDSADSLKPLYHDKPNVRVWGYNGKHAIDRFRHAKRFVKTAKILSGT
jgi:hypothetical protein